VTQTEPRESSVVLQTASLAPPRPAASDDAYEMLDLASESPEQLMAAFAAREWGDGLPLIPPTEERVAAMLAADPGDPEEVLGVVPPRLGRATRRIVAVNAVLAGCPPSVFPVVTAAVRAFCRPEVNLKAAQTTTGPASAMLIVHGEAAERLGYNSGHGLFGPGNIPNATTGRAVRLVLIHVGGAKAGVGSKKTVGQPSHYTYCFAENIAASPWEPYHRSRGIDTPSALTVGTQEGPHNVQNHNSEDPYGILNSFASSIANIGSNTAWVATSEVYVVIGPEHAQTIAAAGWTREDVQLYLYERARVRAKDLAVRGFGGTNPSVRPWRWTDDPDAMLPALHGPDRFRVLVGGGAGKHSAVLHAGGWPSLTVPFDLPEER
jgi:hypothetical protein